MNSGFGEIESRGHFDKTDRNLFDGQDFDVPTYLRKGHQDQLCRFPALPPAPETGLRTEMIPFAPDPIPLGKSRPFLHSIVRSCLSTNVSLKFKRVMAGAVASVLSPRKIRTVGWPQRRRWRQAEGDVILLGDDDTNNLVDYKYQPHWSGERGEHGLGRTVTAGRANPAVLRMPLGTVVIDEATEKVVAEVIEDGQQIVLCKGGNGGLGQHPFQDLRPTARRSGPIPGTRARPALTGSC
jgi:hypothetical protein